MYVFRFDVFNSLFKFLLKDTNVQLCTCKTFSCCVFNQHEIKQECDHVCNVTWHDSNKFLQRKEN